MANLMTWLQDTDCLFATPAVAVLPLINTSIIETTSSGNVCSMFQGRFSIHLRLQRCKICFDKRAAVTGGSRKLISRNAGACLNKVFLRFKKSSDFAFSCIAMRFEITLSL